MRSLTSVLVSAGLVLAACGKETKPEPVVVPPADASAVTTATPTATESASATEPADAGATATAPAAPEELVPGTGSCKVDGDCTLTSHAFECCYGQCGSSATSNAEYAKWRAKVEADGSCRRKNGLCPPPAPCPRQTHRAVRAVCQRGICTTVRVRVAS